MRPTNSLFGIIGCGGTLTIHVPHTKFPIRYLVDSQTLVFLTKMRNEYLRGDQTTWANTDTGIRPLTFYEPDLHRRIAIRELGWGDEFNDFVNRLGNTNDLKHAKGMKESIVELKSLIQ